LSDLKDKDFMKSVGLMQISLEYLKLNKYQISKKINGCQQMQPFSDNGRGERISEDFLYAVDLSMGQHLAKLRGMPSPSRV